jgi:hypothetical protein
MVGVWAATGTPLRATVELQDAQDHVPPIKSHGSRAQAVRGVLLTIHQADRPSSASLIAPQQWFSVVDVGLDACDITYYQAVARSSSGTQLRLRLTDRRSVVRLDCLTNIIKALPPWSVTIHEVDNAATGQEISVHTPIASLDGAPDGDDMAVWRDQRFRDAWRGIIGQRRNPLTAQMHFTFNAVDHADPYVLDFDNARGALQSCGTQFIEAVLEPAGVAPLVEQGSVRNVTYWRIVQCRHR